MSDNQPIEAIGKVSNRIWCRFAGPGRGDCQHFVGLPAVLDQTTTDEYGIPNGWCEYCWSSHQRDDLQRQLVDWKGAGLTIANKLASRTKDSPGIIEAVSELCSRYDESQKQLTEERSARERAEARWNQYAEMHETAEAACNANCEMIAMLTKENERAEARLAAIKLAVDEVATYISDDQGFILDSKEAECTTCDKKAATPSEIVHDVGCFTKVWQDLLKSLSSTEPPVLLKEVERLRTELSDCQNNRRNAYLEEHKAREAAEKEVERLKAELRCPRCGGRLSSTECSECGEEFHDEANAESK